MIAVLAGTIGLGLNLTNRDPKILAGGAGPNCPVTDNVYPHGHPTVRIGSQGDCVRHLQYDLNVIHFFNPDFKLAKTDKPLTVDGDYGPLTENRVKQFQLILNQKFTSGLAVDGVVGPITWEWVTSFCAKTINQTETYVC